MILRIGSEASLNAFVNSSFGPYEDGKSVTGVAIRLGNATIYVKSGKQKIVTLLWSEGGWKVVGLARGALLELQRVMTVYGINN